MRSASVAAPLPERNAPETTEENRSRERAYPEKRVAWWLWPHLLSLDAPLVAIGWQRWWAHGSGANLHWFHEIILGLCVWMIYLADRLSDVRHAEPGDFETRRHAFSQRRGIWLGALLGAVVVSLTGLSLQYLTGWQFAGGLILLALVWIYFCSIHAGLRRWRWRIPKEAAVGSLFAVGTGFFVSCTTVRIGLILAAAEIMFGALCFLNCALITKWEGSPQDQRDPASLVNAFPRLTAWLAHGCMALALLAVVFMVAWRRGEIVFAPVVSGAAGLWTLDRWRGAFSKDALRVMADVVLLAPWFLLWNG